MAGVLFYYIGDDEAYFKTLQGEFKKHTRLNIDFKRLYETKEDHIQALFIKIYKNKPVVVFIDFSKQTQEYLHLARILARTSLENKLVTVGLTDYLSPPEVISESMATGANLTYIKSADSYDVVFDVSKLVAPQEIGAHGFATASLSETLDAGITAKVGYIHREGLHLETDFKVGKGDRIKLNHSWTANKLVPSKEMFIKEVSQSNLFYHFKYNCDADFLFVDEFIPPEGMEDITIQERRKERDEAIHYNKKQLKKWIDDNLSRSQEKSAKMLVIDREFHFYQNQPRTDKHAYIIRCAPYLKDIVEELDKLQPQVIAFAMEPDSAESKNNNEALVKLAEVLKAKFPDLNPSIVVFNCTVSSQDLQNGIAYPHVMATSNELSVEVLMKMADMFDKKLHNSKSAVVGGKNKLEKVFLKKTNVATICEIIIQIKVLKLSESDMIFQCDHPLEVGMNLHLTQPVDMYINVQPVKAQGKKPEYHGLIHCLGETNKKELRRYVNSIFFRDHDAKIEAETAEFKKLNDAKLVQRTEAEKKAADAAAEAAKEEAEKAAEEAAAKEKAATAAKEPEPTIKS